MRTDIAAFAGRCRRGPVGEWVRVEGWRRFEAVFGGLWRPAQTPYALRGYFENGGEVAYVWRLGGADPATAATAWADWLLDASFAAQVGLQAPHFKLRAASPGAWGEGMELRIAFRRRPSRPQTLDIIAMPRSSSATGPIAPEHLVGLPCNRLAEAVAERSAYLRLEPEGLPPGAPGTGLPGPMRRTWTIRLAAATDPPADEAAYQRAIAAAADAPEPALLVLPDLHEPGLGAAEARRLAVSAARRFAETLDRLVLLDLPEPVDLAATAEAWLEALGDDEALPRAATAHHPWLRVDDPLGGAATPQRSVPPSGHIAGVISRLDRERGAGATPANATIDGALDLSRLMPQEELAGMHAIGVNPLLCSAGRGILVWGGRMLGSAEDLALPVQGGVSYVAHRRLIHRLVRAVRRIARPLVFEPNGPALWFALVRGVTTVLLEAWRARVLKGDRPDQGFRVRCDAELNRPEVIEAGQVVCEISLAPAVPMEFITIRVALSAEGGVEVAGP
ncbi:MAG: phage tail sheath family protein [Hyphomicrobiaceae bacterium]